MPTNSGWVTSFGGKIIITANEGTLDEPNNRSLINVTAQIFNGNANQAGPNSSPLSAHLTGSDPQGDNLGRSESNWTVGTVAHNATKTVFTDSVWAAHSAAGGGTATVGWNYQLISGSATAIFGSSGTISVSVPLSQLGGAPSSPTGLVASNILPTSLTLGWDSVSGATDYLIEGQLGDTITSPTINRDTTGTSINITGLAAGRDYTFRVYATNAAGASQPSDPYTVQTLAGSYLRVGGVWKVAIPYVRSGGVWKMALPYIRDGGVWKQTH